LLLLARKVYFVDIKEIFSEAVTIGEDVIIDEQILASGVDVPIKAEIQVGSVGGKPVYLKGAVLSTNPN
jgi:hypothetical protein